MTSKLLVKNPSLQFHLLLCYGCSKHCETSSRRRPAVFDKCTTPTLQPILEMRLIVRWDTLTVKIVQWYGDWAAHDRRTPNIDELVDDSVYVSSQVSLSNNTSKSKVLQLRLEWWGGSPATLFSTSCRSTSVFVRESREARSIGGSKMTKQPRAFKSWKTRFSLVAEAVDDQLLTSWSLSQVLVGQ